MEIKTQYKNLQIILLVFAILLLAFSIYQSYIDYKKLNKSGYLTIFLLVFLIYVVINFFLKIPIIIFDEIYITKKTFFYSKTYKWSEINEVYLSKKENYSIFFILGQYLEATTLKFDNGDKIILWNDMYSNLMNIRAFITDKATDKIKDPVSKIKDLSLKYLDKKVYAGNSFFNVNTILVLGTFAFMFYYIIVYGNNKPSILTLLILPFVLFFGFGFQMNYFIIDYDQFIIKNHYFPWKTKSFLLTDILEMDIERPNKRSTSLRILTKDFQSKLYGAGSLRQKNWDELKQDLLEIGIPIRTD